ncbi:hypothetical protein JI739_18720 [Ramlibacter sp. AW1]|uniref:Lipoprotein n=1 Tax=Ramlibacter aurantiacus TaxID=2801330 RepID=A0A937D379_9BURK|nr:hypothetical protein [Ramlibacter aurantiacus]MBL0422389.1 hypothetical protein [Ramlibacter aurantiacus]
MRFALVLGLLALSGCASVEPQKFVGPSGKTAYTMDCAGYGRTVAECFKRAGEVCPAGYNVVSQTNAPIGIPTMHGLMIMSDDKMAIECK